MSNIIDRRFYLTNGGSPLTFIKGQLSDVERYLKSDFEDKGIDWKNALTIRLYEYFTEEKEENQFDIFVNCLNVKTLKKKKNLKSVWKVNIQFKDTAKKYSATLFDGGAQLNKAIYVLWDVLDKVSDRDCKKEYDDKNNLDLDIQFSGKKLTSHAVLTLFFQKKERCKIWDYRDLEDAILEANPDWEFRKYEARGLGGERPREWKKHMGYEFITNDKDRNVPDGKVKINSPIPTKERNERRAANFDIEKTDWSELVEELYKKPEQLRCWFCGLFEGEINRINEKTHFQKGHLESLSSGGDVSEENIAAQCYYCNGLLNDFFDVEKDTFKLRVNPIKAIEKQSEGKRIEVLEFLLKTMIKKGDPRATKIVNDFLK